MGTMQSRRVGWVLLVFALFVGAACKQSEPEERLVVFAATSLRDVFTDLGADFERAHPGVEVTFHFAGTQQLRTQLEHGAAADVFASADQLHMEALVRGARVGIPVIFARNELVLVASTEGGVQSLGELPRAERVVIGTPEVPIGRYSLQLLDRAGETLGPDFRARVEERIASRELNVRQVLAKVGLGEAQAGIVYATDARMAGGRVRVVPIPPDVNVRADHPIAVVRDAAHPRLARAWVDFLLSERGQRALADAGFVPAGGGGPRS